VKAQETREQSTYCSRESCKFIRAIPTSIPEVISMVERSEGGREWEKGIERGQKRVDYPFRISPRSIPATCSRPFRPARLRQRETREKQGRSTSICLITPRDDISFFTTIMSPTYLPMYRYQVTANLFRLTKSRQFCPRKISCPIQPRGTFRILFNSGVTKSSTPPLSLFEGKEEKRSR